MRVTYLIVNLILLISLYSKSKAQDQTLTRGDILPEINIDNILFGDYSSLNRSAIKGKVLILDFWSTFCSACIAALPKLDTLQKKYADDVIFLAVTNQPKKMIEEFWAKNPNTKNLSLLVVAEDSTLHKLFPHVGVPHIVWIDRNGVIQAITKGEYMVESNIQRIVEGNTLDLPEKKMLNSFENVNLVDINPSILSLNRQPSYVAFAGYLEGFRRQKYFLYDTLSNSTKFKAINFPIISLYKLAVAPLISEDNHIPDNRILLEVKNIDSYHYSSYLGFYDEWLKNNSFSYEVNYPDEIADTTLYATMLDDLDRFFKLNSHWEDRIVECLVLTPSLQERELHLYPKYVAYTSAASFQKYLNTLSELPVFAADSICEDFHVRIPVKKMNFDELVMHINRNGYRLVKEYRKMKMLVISDNHQHLSNKLFKKPNR